MSTLEEVQEMVYLYKYPKWSPYGVALRMALKGRFFEEVYKKPWKYG
jgi:hypothetical protein